MCRGLVDIARNVVNRASTDMFDGIAFSSSGIARGLRRLWRDESGATGIEYGLIIVGISIAILATVFAIGAEMDEMFDFIGSKLRQNMGNFGTGT